MAEGQVTLPALPQQEGVQFRHIPGHPGYCVGDDGSVWCCKGIGGRRGALSGHWRRLRPNCGPWGHQCVMLSPGRKVVAVHRLVLTVFVGPCPQGMQACHFPDRNPGNNTLSNLRWDTPKANKADSIFHGTTPRGERHARSKLTEAVVRAIRTEYEAGNTSCEKLAPKYGVSKSAVIALVSRRTWKHIV